MRHRGRQHLKEVILQLQLLVLNEMRDALDHDHLVGDVLEQDFLLLKGDDFLGLLLVVCLRFIHNTKSLICHFIFNDSEIETLGRYRGIHNAQLLFSVIAYLADIKFGLHIIRVATLVIHLDSGLSNHLANRFYSGVIRDGENTIELLILECHLLIIILH
jgi:hypothetical protein